MAITTRNELVEALALIGITGLARAGDLDVLFEGGADYVLPAATTTVTGGVKQSAAVANLAAQTVTDIATAQASITAIVTKLNALLAAQRTAGQLAP
jgi:hypothetical protein